ncbi:hypothetical protein SRIMM317S_06064 [Streptomyces rimosus subsp. rimosus]
MPDQEPASAPAAGCRLIITAKPEAGSLRRASSSRVYGVTEDSSATAAPSPIVTGSSRAVPALVMPSGRLSSAANDIARARPSACGKR